MELVCVGDVAIADVSVLKREWEPPLVGFPGEDTRILLNWELPIGETVNPVPRSSGPRLLAHPHSPQVVHKWSPGIATLATNHILDAGESGLVNTMESLSNAGFMTVGAGRNEEEITAPLFWETVEGRLAILNWVFPETHPDWMHVPGPNCWPSLNEARHIIQRIRSHADWVLVVVHWSDELFPYPRPGDRTVAYELVSAGADLIIGHHPHVVRGAETIGTCPVFYSLGDFYFSDVADGQGGWITRRAPRNREGLGVWITFRRGHSPIYRVLPFWQANGHVTLDTLRRATKRMEHVSRPLEQFQGSAYAEWYISERSRFDRWGYRWHFGLWQMGWRGLIRRLTKMLHLCTQR